MSRFLEFLGVTITESTPRDIIDGGNMIDGLQMIYEDMPSGSRKDAFANAIAETAAILLRKINTLKGITNPNISQELEQLEVVQNAAQQQSYEEEVEEIENIPNPTQDTNLDKVDPPIDRDAPPATDTNETVNKELQDLIESIHKLEF